MELAPIPIEKSEQIGTMKRLASIFIIGILMILGSGLFPAESVAQDKDADDPLLDRTGLSKQYLVQLSGTVMNETFSGAQVLLALHAPLVVSRYNNPYLVIIEGFPKRNSTNSFFWNSEDSEMTAIANEITCDIKRTFIKGANTFFSFLSPELLRHTGALETRAGDEGKRLAESVALPTAITARAGRLTLRIHSNSVSGTVWMKGYDPIEKAFVQYSARLYGRKSYNLMPKQDQKKGTTVRE